MSNKPILKVVRPGYNLVTATDRDLSFSSGWETPKIFLQTSSNWTNTLGYIPSIMVFRQLNSSDFTHDSQVTDNPDTDQQQGAFLNNYTGNLSITKRGGDTNMFALLHFLSLSGMPSSAFNNKTEPFLIVAKEDYQIQTSPTNLYLDSRFDTFKIFKTGTLELEMPAETLVINAPNKTYTKELAHNLGYPPVYLPQAGVNWDLGYSGVWNSSFIVNDYVGLLRGSQTGRAILDVYVDSNKLYMKCTRKSNAFFDVTFNAVTITMYYTIFYNEIGEEFNLLD